MAHITAITASKRHPQRAAVKVGGRTVASLSTKLIAELGLRVGQDWGQELMNRVEQAAAYDRALRAAMTKLNRRAMSRQRLDLKLQGLRVDKPIRQQVLDRLSELGLLDEEAMGRAVIRQITRRQPAGPHLLRQKLHQWGLPRDVIDRLIAEVTDVQDPIQSATELARGHLPQLRQVRAAIRNRRLYNLLARRGFEADTIETALQTLTDGLNGHPGS